MKKLKVCFVLVFLSLKVFSKNLDTLNVQSFGAIADNQTDNTININRAISSLGKRSVLYFPKGTFIIKGSIQLKSDIILLSRGGVLKQVSPNTPILMGNGIANVDINGVKFCGLGSDYANVGNYTKVIATGIFIDGKPSYNINIKNCTFDNLGSSAMHLANVTKFNVINNLITGPISYLSAGQNFNFGVYIGFESNGGLVSQNIVQNVAQGMFFAPNTHNIKVINNQIKNIIGQHGMYVAGGDTLTIQHNVINTTHFCGIKVQLQYVANNHDIKNILIQDNRISNSGSHSILVMNIDANKTKYLLKDVHILDNIIDRGTNSGDGGISIIKCSNINVENNRIQGGNIGMIVRDVNQLLVRNNTIAGSGITGISLQSESDYTDKKTRLLSVLAPSNSPINIADSLHDIKQTKNIIIDQNTILLAKPSSNVKQNPIYEGSIINLKKTNNIIH